MPVLSNGQVRRCSSLAYKSAKMFNGAVQILDEIGCQLALLKRISPVQAELC
jgi:hypothetical protein